MLTGRLPAGHGVYGIHDTLPADQVLLPEHLARLGYETALVGKLHVSGRAVECVERHPHDGFERYEWSIDPQVHLDSPFNAHAAWLREHHPEFLGRLLTGSQDHHPAEAHFSTWAAERAVAFLQRARRGAAVLPQRQPVRSARPLLRLPARRGRTGGSFANGAGATPHRGASADPGRRGARAGAVPRRPGQGVRPAAPRHRRDSPRLPGVNRLPRPTGRAHLRRTGAARPACATRWSCSCPTMAT